MTKSMPWYEFAPGDIEIDEFDCASVFLFIGEKRALLLDTGIGIGDLRGLVEELTDKPYDVVLSHGHGDHVGGLGPFGEFWINPKDIGKYPIPADMNMRKQYPVTIALREHKHYPYSIPDDCPEWPEGKPVVYRELEDGHVFDLGGRTITAYECPGHTPGEMVFIDDKNRILFCGDAVNNYTIICSDPTKENFVSVEEAEQGLARIISMQDRYTQVYNSHHDYRGFGAPLGRNVIFKLHGIMKSIVDGNAELKEVPDPMAPQTGVKKLMAVADDDITIIKVQFDGRGVRR